ncbi:MAG: class I SAM-dependent methyltransferase [Chloroflexi bacterium]|nr:class I SAM-dependent methyltransferase [Chloroflexota bacterium]
MTTGPYARWTSDALRREAERDASPAARAALLLPWREIERRLPEVRTVLDVGAGVGRFSLELARRGCEVVHVEADPVALAAAVAQARAERLRTIRFVRGALPGLGWLKTGVFDLVLCLDGAISFAYPRHKEAASELVRVGRRWIILGVVNRMTALRQWVESDLHFTAAEQQAPRLLREGVYDPGEAFSFFHPEALPPLYAFHPEELRQTLEHLGCHVPHLCAPGALAATLAPEALQQTLADERRRAAFLDLAAQYDANGAAMGVAPREMWGTLLATARRDPDALLFRPPGRARG